MLGPVVIKTPPHRLKEMYHGRVYAVRIGEKIKIGKTKNIDKRLKALEQQALYHGMKVWLIITSKLHVNYSENEKILHKKFQDKRIKGTELFEITQDEVVSAFSELKYPQTSERMKNHDKESSDFINMIINAGRKSINDSH